MGRVKELWMKQIEEICDRYIAERLKGGNANEAFGKGLKDLRLLGVDSDQADEWLEAAWSSHPAAY